MAKNETTIDSGWISEAEAAQYIGYSVESLRKMRARGYVNKACTTKMLPYYKIARNILYRKADIDTWMKQFRKGE